MPCNTTVLVRAGLLSFKFPLSLLIILGGVNAVLVSLVSPIFPYIMERTTSKIQTTNLVVIDGVDPWDNMDKHLRISRVPRRHPL